ncbi:MAG TPA: undecaprenyldiphospho-muramoylpentapeptide beta-N-acetylglucosaminyltransferase [Burkholderiaceae bacterium]|jgi:UDP-N-acetylglucosamine--N-acetylmuramyl-(pentapeptide) pyrophosphoryl-undecaprenol N-acetylglucosamine transferase|nr:undecaprenyldiphospho-muramoylpentapeptide beta-N-acetylglucosaminyltransferase [Burkholderiaceae bacterium]
MSAAAATSAPVAPRHLMVVAAGTGGHVMPGVAVAELLRARGWRISWLGTRTGIERGLVAPLAIDFDAVPFSGLRGKGLRGAACGSVNLVRAFAASRRAMRRRAPDVVFATGGYVAVPAGAAAASRRVPFALLNADASPQLSMRVLRPITTAVLCGFDGSASRIAGRKAIVTGAPVRERIASLAPPEQRLAGRSGPLRLLVVGGSLGARVLNQTIPAALARMPADRRPQVMHQCGGAHVEATGAAYAAAGVQASVCGFIEDIAQCYQEADLVVCRAGAITVSELCAAGVAAILVPLVVSTTDHQRFNAEFLASRGAALHVPQERFDAQALAQLLGGLTREQILAIAQRARSLGHPDATAAVASAIESLARAGR